MVNFENGFAATYTWNTSTRSWARSIFGAPDVTDNGVQISPKNVIVMTVNYVGGAGVIDSYAQLVGSGPVEVFSGGVVQHGTWSRSNLYHRAIYRNLAGKVINLNPGQTWVEPGHRLGRQHHLVNGRDFWTRRLADRPKRGVTVRTTMCSLSAREASNVRIRNSESDPRLSTEFQLSVKYVPPTLSNRGELWRIQKTRAPAS